MQYCEMCGHEVVVIDQPDVISELAPTERPLPRRPAMMERRAPQHVIDRGLARMREALASARPRPSLPRRDRGVVSDVEAKARFEQFLAAGARPVHPG